MADTIHFGEFAPRPAAWPSGKAEDCKSFTPSSNLGAAFLQTLLTSGSISVLVSFSFRQPRSPDSQSQGNQWVGS